MRNKPADEPMLQRPLQWLRQVHGDQAKIISWAGWVDKDLNEPITQEEFETRLAKSSFRRPNGRS